MKRLLITAFASLLAVALMAPATQAASQVRQIQVDLLVPVPGNPTNTKSAGTLTLDVVFKNKKGNKKKYTPRQLTRVDLSKLELTCTDHMTFTNQFHLTQTFQTQVKFKKIPHPHPKPDRYAFSFAYSFPTFTGSITGTIDKVTNAPKPRAPRAHGDLVIQDLDADAGHPNCATDGPLGWSDLSLTTL